MTREEEAAGRALLEDPKLIDQIDDDLTTMGVVKENAKKTLCYLIATSRKMSECLAATIKAGSSSGKNHLVKGIKALIPDEDIKEFTYASAKSLLHMQSDALKHKVLILTETVGKQEAEYLVRALLSEKILTSSVTVREYEGGPFTTQESTVEGPCAYFDTTTSMEIHPENATRVFEIYLNETEEQTKEIIEQQAREAGHEGFEIKQKREEIRKLHHTAQRLLRTDLEVIVPFASYIKFPAGEVRARRDFPKLLNLIKVIAFLYQFQRPVKKYPDDTEYIEATLDDYQLAYPIVKETFADTLDDLDKRSRTVFEAIKTEVQKKANVQGKQIDQVDFDRSDIARWAGKRKNKLQPIFTELETKEYILPSQGGTTTRRIYRLNSDRLNEKGVLDVLTTPERLREILERDQLKSEGQIGGHKDPSILTFSSLSHLSHLSPCPNDHSTQGSVAFWRPGEQGLVGQARKNRKSGVQPRKPRQKALSCGRFNNKNNNLAQNRG